MSAPSSSFRCPIVPCSITASGIGPELRELTYSFRPKLDSEGSPIRLGRMLVRPDAAATIFRRLLGHEAIEVCGVLCLTTRRRVICWHEVSRGSLDRTSVHPREIFKPAFMVNASAVIVGHNHPSGDPEPSGDDFEMTERLVRAGHLLGLDVIDHIIIGHDSFVSLKNHCYWPKVARNRREPSVAAGAPEAGGGDAFKDGRVRREKTVLTRERRFSARSSLAMRRVAVTRASDQDSRHAKG